MANALRYAIGGEPSAAESKLINGGLDGHAQKTIGVPWHYVTITARDDAGALQGGLVSYHAGRSLLIMLLWIDDAQRGRGVGRKLMMMAEEEALKRKCARISVDTLSYQAPVFYEKLGFKHKTTIPDWYEGHDRIFFEKTLTEEK